MQGQSRKAFLEPLPLKALKPLRTLAHLKARRSACSLGKRPGEEATKFLAPDTTLNVMPSMARRPFEGPFGAFWGLVKRLKRVEAQLRLGLC